MKNAEITAIIIAQCEAKHGKWIEIYPDYPNGNYSYIACDKDVEQLTFCLKHPEFSHFNQRDRFSVTIYWHCEGSPTGVRSVGAFDPEMISMAYRILGDFVTAASCEYFSNF